jgi:peptide/nickel transport system substrate-binding protein
LAATGAGVLGAAFLAACSGDDDSSDSSSSSGSSAGSGPNDRRVVMAVGPAPAESPRPTDIGAPFAWINGPAYEYLLGVSLKGEVNVPQLAESWNVEPDGKSIRFKLRRGVPFHNGKGEFSAQDVIYSWQLFTAPDSLEDRRERFLKSVQDIQVVNDYELVFHLTSPDSAFIYSFGETDYGLKIVSKADGESRTRWSFDDPFVAGTGPYKVKEWKQGQYVRFERASDKHYRRTPDFKEFEYRMIPDASTRLAALLAKEVDIAVLPGDLQNEAEGRGFKKIRAQAEGGTGVILSLRGTYLNQKFNSADPEPIPGGQQYRYPNTPLLDDRVRKAMNKAINRDELNKGYWGGNAELMYNWAYVPSRPGWNEDWVKRFPAEYGYDPAEAKKLLAAAGYDSSRPLEHTLIEGGGYGNFPELADLLESIAGYFRAVGIQVKLETTESAVFRARRAKLEYDNHSHLASLSVNQFVGMAAAGGVSSGYVGSRGWSEFAEPIALMHDQPNGLRWTIDPKKADPLWRRLGDMQYDLHAPIPLFWLPVYALVNKDTVADYEFSGALGGIYTNVEYIKSA